MNAEQKRLFNLHRLFGVFGSMPGQGNPGFSLQKRFIAIGQRSSKCGIGYRQVKWAMEVIRLYNDGRRHGYTPQYPSEATILPPRHKYNMEQRPASALRSLRSRGVVGSAKSSKAKSAPEKKRKHGQSGWIVQGRVHHKTVGRVAAKDLLFNKQQRDTEWVANRNRAAATRARRKRLRS